MPKKFNLDPEIRLIPYYEYNPAIHEIEYRYFESPEYQNAVQQYYTNLPQQPTTDVQTLDDYRRPFPVYGRPRPFFPHFAPFVPFYPSYPAYPYYGGGYGYGYGGYPPYGGGYPHGGHHHHDSSSR